VEEIFFYYFEIYIKFGYKNPSILTLYFSAELFFFVKSQRSYLDFCHLTIFFLILFSVSGQSF
jgi:hypothetical protein